MQRYVLFYESADDFMSKAPPVYPRHLDRLKTWLSKHHLLVMAGLLVVFGVLLISHGVRGLLGH